LRIKYEYKEKTLSIFSQDHSPDLAIIGGIVIEHIHEKIREKSEIKTEIGGRGGRLSFYLKKYKLNPIAFSFLAEDEFLNFILSTYEVNNIPLTWSTNGKQNKRKIRIIDENKCYTTNYYQDSNVDPIYIEEYVCNVDNLFFAYEQWMDKLIDVLFCTEKKTFVDIDLSEIKSNPSFSCNFLFVSNFENKDLSVLENTISDYKIIFNKKNIQINDDKYNLDLEGKYYEEAISAYQTVFLYYIITKRNIKKSHEFAFDAYKKTLKEGKI
jgi:hypothetical protein